MAAFETLEVSNKTEHFMIKALRAADALNLLISLTGMLLKIDVAMIGRMAAGRARGRFRYAHPGSRGHQIAPAPPRHSRTGRPSWTACTFHPSAVRIQICVPAQSLSWTAAPDAS